MNRRSVLGEQREPDVVRRRDRPAERVLVHVPDLEVLEEPPPPTLFDRHQCPPRSWHANDWRMRYNRCGRSGLKLPPTVIRPQEHRGSPGQESRLGRKAYGQPIRVQIWLRSRDSNPEPCG